MVFLHTSALKLNDYGLLLKPAEPSKGRAEGCFRSKQRVTPTPNIAKSRILLPILMEHSDQEKCGEDGLTVKFHGNLWKNDLIQSLQTPYGDSSYQQRAERLVLKMKDMFKALGDGEISPSAYDTAWVERVPSRHQDGSQTPQFPEAIKWLLNNQLQDGSWGFPSHEAVRRWDISLLDQFPESKKDCFKLWFETINEIDAQALTVQGRDMLEMTRKVWEMNVEAFLQERERIADGYIPTLEEYLETSCISISFGCTTFQPLLVKGDPLTDNILHQVHHSSKLLYLVSLCTRLSNDRAGFQAERTGGKPFCSIECYMRDNPGSTEEDALKHLRVMTNEGFKETNLEYFKVDEVPTWCKKFLFTAGSSGQAFYKYADGYSDSKGKVEDYIRKVLMDPVDVI